MSSQRILLVIQNDESDPPHLAGQWLQEIGYELRVIRAFAGEPIPQQIDDEITALMPLGGHMGAMDDHVAPWLANIGFLESICANRARSNLTSDRNDRN